MRLRSREKQIPEGFVFYEPSTKWRSTPWASFQTVVQEVIAHRKGNPHLMQKLGKSTDQREVENEVDEFNANICAQMNWLTFVVGNEGSPPPNPKSKPPSQEEVSRLAAVAAKTKNAWAGAKTLSEWVFSNIPAVPQDQSNSRAAVCVVCPNNGAGDFTKWFVRPLASLIERQMAKRVERKLVTDYDEKLGVCTACDCPMALKCHAPIEIIKSHMPDSVLDNLRTGKNCWILKELDKT